MREKMLKMNYCSGGLGGSREEPRLEDAFSDEEGSGFGGNSPSRNSYPIQSITHGDLSDDEIGNGSTSPEPANGFESLCITNNSDYSPTQHHQQCARSRSGSGASRRSQLSQFRWVLPLFILLLITHTYYAKILLSLSRKNIFLSCKN